MFRGIMTQSLMESVIWKIQWQNCNKATLGREILVISLYFLKYGNVNTQFPFELSTET